ncbi:MAG: DedA family protein [Candidatus Dormibacteraceae bacterium]
MTQALTHLIDSYGLLAVFLLMLVESCGIPFPSEIIMPAAGVLAFGGHLSLPAVIVVGAAGNLAGSLIAYGLAARFGEALLLGPGRRIGISPSHLRIAQRWFDRHGLLAVLLGRDVPVVRTYISFPAGLARVQLAPFTLLTFIGALPWCAWLAVAGYELGQRYDRISGSVSKAAIVIAVLALLGLVAWYLRGRSPAVLGEERSKPR